MKKTFAMLLCLCLLLCLGACGGDGGESPSPSSGGDNIAITNSLDCGIEDIFIVPAGADTWGQDAVGYVDPGTGAYWYPEGLTEVDIQFVDEYDTAYEFYGLAVSAGDTLELSIAPAGDAILLKNGSEAYVGGIIKGNSFAELCNGLDFDIAELYVFAADTSERGEAVATGLSYLDSCELSLTDLCGARELLADILLVDEYGDSYIFEDVALVEGSKYTFGYDELDNPILSNDADGWEYDSDRLEGGASDHILSDLEGMWEDTDSESYILFYGDLTWDSVNFDGKITGSGEYEFLGREVILHMDSDELSLRWSGDYALRGNNLNLSHVCSFDSPVYEALRELVNGSSVYFEDMGYTVNYKFGEGGSYFTGGAAAYTQDGSFYQSLPVTVGMVLDRYTDTQDGYAEVVFTENAWLDVDDYPSVMLTNNSTISVSTVLCDYYTGYWLTETSTNGSSPHGDNYFHYEYESCGRSISVDYSYSAEWIMAGDGSLVFTKQYIVRMPADYDGLVYVHTASYRDYESMLEGQKILPDEGELCTVNDPRLENSVICRINSLD